MDKCENYKDEFGESFCHEDYPPRSCRCEGDRTACERGNGTVKPISPAELLKKMFGGSSHFETESGMNECKNPIPDGINQYEAVKRVIEGDCGSVKKIRQEVLEKAIHMVCGDREDDYGDPEDSFAVIAGFWEVYIKAKCAPKDTEITILPEDVAALMALFKIARIASGRFKMDSWVDCAGYCANGAELQRRGK